MAPLAHKSGKAIVALFKSKANPSRWLKFRGYRIPKNTVHPHDRLQFEKLLTKYRQQATWVNPKEISHNKLRNIVNDLYRPNAKIGSGSTADAVRVEISVNNLKVGGKRHVKKVEEDYLPAIEKLLTANKLNPHEKMIEENIRLDLLDSLGDRLWYSQTTTPKL